MPRKPRKSKTQAAENLALFTVPELRAKCKAMGLPAYQAHGKRLDKAGLIAQLEAAGAGKSKATPAKAKKAKAKTPPKATRRKRVVVVGGNVIHVSKPAEPVTAAQLAEFQNFELLSMARGLDRHCDPAMSRRALVSCLVASEKPLEELKAGKRKSSGGRGAKNLSGSGWTDQGRAIGVKTVMC